MKNVLERLTTRVERELKSRNCVVDIFKVKNLEKLKDDNGKYSHNNIPIILTETTEVSMRDNYTCVECKMTASYVVLTKNNRSNTPNAKYIPFYYIIDSEKNELRKLTKDHIIPKALGGANRMTNYQCMCEVCNTKKSHLFYGLDIDKIVREKIEEDRKKIGEWVTEEFKRSSIFCRIFGLPKFVNNLLNKLFKTF